MDKEREKVHADESGYSEEQQAKDIESQKDLKIIKKRKPIQTVSREEKILQAYKEITHTIEKLVEVYQDLHATNIRQAEKVLEEVKELRIVQDELLSSLTLEREGQLDETSVSKEVWNLIE